MLKNGAVSVISFSDTVGGGGGVDSRGTFIDNFYLLGGVHSRGAFIQSITVLASVSLWPLLIIESRTHVLFMHDLLVKQV